MKKLYFLLVVCGAVAACSHFQPNQEKVVKEVYADDAARYRQNVATKAEGENFVTYEYKDVRIDELAPLASRYCEDKAGGKQAYLRDILLYRNNLRRATFDCLNLAMED